MLQGWVLYVIIYEKYIIEVVCEYVCVQLGGLYGFDGNEHGVLVGCFGILVVFMIFGCCCWGCIPLDLVVLPSIWPS